MLIILTLICAVLIGWAFVMTALRWSAAAVGPYPHIAISSSALYVLLALAFTVVEASSVANGLLLLIHCCFAASSLTWWWTSLRISAALGSPVGLPAWLTHALPCLLTVGPLALAFAGAGSLFISGDKQQGWSFHPGWVVLVSATLSVSLATVIFCLQRAVKARLADDRAQFLYVGLATLPPAILGAFSAMAGGPIVWVTVGYGLASMIILGAIYRRRTYPGLAVSLDALWATDPHPCLVLDRHFRLIYANESAQSLLPQAAQRGSAVLDWLPGELHGRNGEQIELAELVNHGLQESMSLRLLRLGGQADRLYTCEVRPMTDDGYQVGVVLTLRDETTHEKFREAALAARRIDSLSHMAGSVAHRFNNLLVSVVGNVDIVKYEIESESLDHQAVREILYDIQAAGQQAAELAKQLVTFTGNQLGEFESLDLNLTVHEALDLIGKRLSGSVRCDVALASSRLEVCGDRSQLIELVLNLVSNAEEAYGAQGGSIRVTTGFRRVDDDDLLGIYNRSGMEPGEYAFIEVTDHGPGLPQDISDRLFDPFVTSKGDAQGLGLATVLGTAIAHLGGIEVLSDARGSRFTIYIPRLPSASVASVSGEPIAPVTRETCLIVDDDPEVLSVHRAMLESLGQSTTATESPADALEMARMYRFALALVDVAMPEMRGDELVRKIREVDPELPVILVSGYADEHAEVERLKGRTTFIEKPFGLTELHEAMLEVTREDSVASADVVRLSLVQERQD